MNQRPEARWAGKVLGSMYVIAVIATTPFAYAGTLWPTASERGWQAQAPAVALVVGWLALVVAALLVWQDVKARRRQRMIGVVSCSFATAAAYSLALTWGGRLLI